MTELKSKKDRTQDWLQAHLGHLSLRCHHCHQALSLEGYLLGVPEDKPTMAPFSLTKACRPSG